MEQINSNNKDFLIYLCCGCDPTYAQLVDVCIQSIIANNDMKRIDVVILCDKAYRVYLNHLLCDYVFIHETAENSSPVDCAQKKLTIFEVPNIMQYKGVLFLDSDILISGDLISTIFESSNHMEGVLYVCEEGKDNKDPHRDMFWSVPGMYTEDDIDRLNTNNVRPFNSGQFFFVPCFQMKEHFSIILKWMNNWKQEFNRAYEQGFMNTYFHLHGQTDSTLLEKVTCLFGNHSNTINQQRNQFNSIIVHFCGSPTAQDALQGMKTLFSLNSRYTPEMKNCVNRVNESSHKPFFSIKSIDIPQAFRIISEDGLRVLTREGYNVCLFPVDQANDFVYSSWWKLFPAFDTPHQYFIQSFTDETLHLVFHNDTKQLCIASTKNGHNTNHKKSAKWHISRVDGGVTLIQQLPVWYMALDDTGVNKDSAVIPHMWKSDWKNKNQRFRVTPISALDTNKALEKSAKRKPFLVYFVSGNDPLFAQMTEMCVRSIVLHNNMKWIDICIICTDGFSVYFDHLIKEFPQCVFVQRLYTTTQHDHVFSFGREALLHIGAVPHLSEYVSILYLDSDVIVCGSLIPLFETQRTLQKDAIHLFNENWIFEAHKDTRFFVPVSSLNNTDTDFDQTISQAFNMGHILFKWTKQIETHFQEMARLFHKYKNALNVQCIMNMYMQKKTNSVNINSSCLSSFVRICSPYSPDNNPDRFEENRCIVHFCGYKKQKALNTMYNHYRFTAKKASDFTVLPTIYTYNHNTPTISVNSRFVIRFFHHDEKRQNGEKISYLLNCNEQGGIHLCEEDKTKSPCNSQIWQIQTVPDCRHVYEIQCVSNNKKLHSVWKSNAVGASLPHMLPAWDCMRQWFISRTDGKYPTQICSWANHSVAFSAVNNIQKEVETTLDILLDTSCWDNQNQHFYVEVIV